MYLSPCVAIAVGNHNTALLKVASLALAGALMVYAPLVFVGSWIIADGFSRVFIRFRFLYFVVASVLSLVLLFNLSQLMA